MTAFSARPGDRVRTLRSIFSGSFDSLQVKVPSGSVGVFREFRPLHSTRGGFRMVAVVDFPGNAGQATNASNLVNLSGEDAPTDAAKARRLCNAHRSLARAQSDLATAHDALAGALQRLADAEATLQEVKDS